MSSGLLLLLAVLGLVFLRKVYRRHYRRAAGYLTLIVLLSLAGYFHRNVTAHLETYAAILEERDIAEIRMQQEDGMQKVVIRDLVNQQSYQWEPKGDAWYIELRILKLNGICKVLGWPDYYRLARLQSEHVPLSENQPGTIHSVQLQQLPKGYDIWANVRRLMKNRPDLVDGIEACITAETLRSEPEPVIDVGVYRFSFNRLKLNKRQL